MIDEITGREIPKEGLNPFTAKKPNRGYILDAVQLWNERTNGYDAGWEHRFNKRQTFNFFKAEKEVANTAIYSKSFFCAPYRNALLFLNVAYSGDNSQTLLFELEFSDDNVNFYPCWHNWFGYDMIVVAMMPHKDCMPFQVLAPYVRLKYTPTGCAAQSYLTITAFAIFNGV